MHPKKIKATYKNGVIKPLDKINLPEGQALEIQIKTLPSVTSELSRDQKRELIQKTRGSMKGTWGSTVEEIDAYIMSERKSWDREFFRILDIRSVDSQVVSVLLDTSILIYYLEGVEPYYPLTEEIFNDIADENIRGSLSAISITEFVTKPLADGKVIVVEYFKQFLSALSIQVLAVTYDTKLTPFVARGPCASQC